MKTSGVTINTPNLSSKLPSLESNKLRTVKHGPLSMELGYVDRVCFKTHSWCMPSSKLDGFPKGYVGGPAFHCFRIDDRHTRESVTLGLIIK